MGEYGLFEADAHAQAEPERQQRTAAVKLQAAIDAVRRDYGGHLAAATGVDDFDDRWNFARHDIRHAVKEFIPPVSGIMRRVKNAMKAEWKAATGQVLETRTASAPQQKTADFLKGAPFATYKDFKDCLSANSDKDDPKAYCGYIKHQTEDKKTSSHREREASIRLELSRRDLQAAFAELGALETWHGTRTAGQDGDEPELHTEQTFEDHQGENLVPEGDFDGYLSEVDQGAPAKVQPNFGQGGDTGADRHGSRLANGVAPQWVDDQAYDLGHPEYGHPDWEDPRERELRNYQDEADRSRHGAKSGEEVSDQAQKLRENAGKDTDEKRKEMTSSIALDLYTDWATTNGLRCASRQTLETYASLGISDSDYSLIEASIRQAEIPPQFRDDDDDDEERAHEAEDEEEDIQDDEDGDDSDDSDEDEDDDDSDDEDEYSDDDEDDDEDEGDESSDEDEEDDDGDDEDDDRRDPPWITGSHERVQMQRDMAWAIKADRLRQASGLGPTTWGHNINYVPPTMGGWDEARMGYPDHRVDDMTRDDEANVHVPPDLGGMSREEFEEYRNRHGRRHAAFPSDDDSDQQDDGGGQPPPDQGAPPQQGAPAPQGPAAGPAGPGPVENQPAEDALLGTAADAVMQMIDRETQEYQTIIDPLTQALQAIEYAQQVEQAEHPLDVTPPQGTVDVTPAAAAGGAQDLQKQQLAAGMRWLQAKCDQTGSPYPVELTSYLARRFQAAEAQRQRLAKVLPQMTRIAKAYGMPRNAVKMVLTAMGRRHYQTVSDAIRDLPPGVRPGIAASLADMFAQDNPHFKHEHFYAQSGVAAPGSRLGFSKRAAEGDVPWGPLEGPLEHPFADEPALKNRYSDDEFDWDKWSELHHNDPARKYGPELGPYHPGADMQRYLDAEPESLGKYDDLSREMAQREMARTSRRRQAGNPRDRAGDSYAESRDKGDREHERHDLDPSNWEDSYEGASPVDNPWAEKSYRRTHSRQASPEGQQAYGGGDWNPDSPIGAYRNFADSKWSGEVSHNSLRDFLDHIGPHRFEPGDLGPLLNHVDSIAVGQQREAKSWSPTPTLDTFQFPQSKAPTPNDNLSVDNLPGTTPTGNASAKATPVKPVKPITTAAGLSVEAKNVVDVYKGWASQRANQGLNLGDAVNLSKFEEEAQPGPKAMNTLKTTLGLGSGGGQKTSSFFTRRVPGWRWDDHQNAYITSARRSFECSCGAEIPTPSYTNCRCGKIWYSYPIGTADHLAANTADMFITREIPVREGVIMANQAMAKGLPAYTAHRHTTACECEESEGQTWIEDEDRGDVDVGHAPAPRKQGRWHYAEDTKSSGGYGVVPMTPGTADKAVTQTDPFPGSPTFGQMQDPSGSHMPDVHPPGPGAGPITPPADQLPDPRGPGYGPGSPPLSIGHPPHTGAIGPDDHTVVYRDGERFCSKCNALLWDPNVHHCPAKQASTHQAMDWSTWKRTTYPEINHEAFNKLPEEQRRAMAREYDEHVRGLSGSDRMKLTRRHEADWTKYDDANPQGGRRKPPSTEVKQPPSDWAARDADGNWMGPAVPRTSPKR